MEPLSGYTVGVTADRRADEQIEMLVRRGARVQHGPSIRTQPLGPESGLRAATRDLVERPPDVLVANTGIGIRSWFGSAYSWGIGEELVLSLDKTRILARGPKAAGAVLSEGLDVGWRAPSETMAEVVDHVLAHGPERACRVAFQLDGGGALRAMERLTEAGADVVQLPIYRWTMPEKAHAAQRLVRAVLDGEVDAVTFTSAPALTNLVELAGPDADMLVARFNGGRPSVTAVCVGPVTASAAAAVGIDGAVVPAVARLGAMVRALGDHLAGRARCFQLAGVDVVMQGAALSLGATGVRLSGRERALLDALLDAGGGVLSKSALSTLAWGGAEIDEHTIEVTVNRLRRKLGPAAAALQTTARRGYRLAVTKGQEQWPRPPGTRCRAV